MYMENAIIIVSIDVIASDDDDDEGYAGIVLTMMWRRYKNFIFLVCEFLK